MVKVYTKRQAKKYLPTRKKTDNKTKGGKCLVVAGSKGMWGAAVLAASAAARVGAGYVYLKPLGKNFSNFQHPDFLLLSARQKKLDIFNAIALGPGAQSPQIGLWLRKVKLQNHPYVVLDAEALNYLAKNNLSVPPTWILTPHEGELARLLSISSKKIKAQRLKYVKLAQKKYGCIIVLKGNQTLIASQKEIWKIATGNVALAKAGTGDVLTGMIAGFLSQGLTPIEAACLGAFVHGYIAEQWLAQKNDVLSLMATDILNLLPSILKKLR